jgi:hypothetical protein
MSLTPKNWASFQHYRNRAPAWIKLHRALLSDFAFTRLPVASRALAPMLWLLASEYEDGIITASREEIAFRLHMSDADLDDALKPLISSCFFYDSEALAERKQDAIPEKRREEVEERDKKEKEEETEKRGEREKLARADLRVVQEGEGEPVLIDASYEPSDRAVEYAYSLGMKQADLKSELSKFIALSMASRAKSYNPDMSFKAWCDRWLDFKRQKDPDWKPTPEKPAEPVEDRSNWQIVVGGTLEHTCWNVVRRERGERPLFLCKQKRKDGTIVDNAALCPTLFPPGFNDFGERIEPASEDAA